ncbi:hypothetical protein ACIA8K_25750 [Catenuloplanes sp. NPDC051500]|uniref:hypothetical protein n=1 Tax=Catenuloplanes sp. NPDC051500 TaxID=3363959 RepID=UPI0037A6C4E7
MHATADPEAYHRMLLRLSGRMPDDLISETRRWLAAGLLTEVAQAVTFAALTGRVAVTEDDAALLVTGGADPDAVAGIARATVDEPSPFGAAPVGPDVLADHGDRMPHCLDLTGGYDGPGAADDLDRTAVAAVTGMHAVGDAESGRPVALWRGWRYPGMITAWPPPKRVFLLLAGGTGAARLAAGAQSALEAAGERHPQVEVFADPDELPPYQRTTFGMAALLWAAEPAVPVRVAPIFPGEQAIDGIAAPGFGPDHPTLDDGERAAVLSYLDSGAPLVLTTERAPDLVRPERHGGVPMSFRTDGGWIWADAIGFYLREYHLAPDPGLLAAIRAHGHRTPAVGPVALHRALTALYALPEPR